jgi:ADP-heptose:LPS heptosyltransferase
MLINEVSGEVMSSPIDYKYDSAEPIKKFKSGIVVHMLAASGTRTPMTSFWRKLINLILDNTNLVVYLTGSQQDSVEINRILDGRAGENRLKNLAGEVNIKELCSLIDESILYIGVDTGITHLASFLHKQSVVIGNRSNPCWLPYYNDKAVIINSKQSCSCDGDRKKDCRIETIEGLKLKCVVDIPVEEVWNAVRRLI